MGLPAALYVRKKLCLQITLQTSLKPEGPREASQARQELHKGADLVSDILGQRGQVGDPKDLGLVTCATVT